MAIEPDEFRAALRRWSSGVSVVTTRLRGSDGGSTGCGMTVSAFMSLSMSPPLIGVCLKRGTRALAGLQQSGRFAVNVLAATQAHCSQTFAGGSDEQRATLLADAGGDDELSPELPGALAQLQCTVEASHEVGDHVLCVGEIFQTSIRPGEPLIYFDGQYCAAAPLAQEADQPAQSDRRWISRTSLPEYR